MYQVTSLRGTSLLFIQEDMSLESDLSLVIGYDVTLFYDLS